jgi:hypothetical protein
MGGLAGVTARPGVAVWGLLLAGAWLAGCQTPVRLMPTPLVFRNSDIDPFEHAGYQAPSSVG